MKGLVLRPFSYTNQPGNCQLFSAIYHNHITLAYSENGYVGKFVAPQKKAYIYYHFCITYSKIRNSRFIKEEILVVRCPFAFEFWRYKRNVIWKTHSNMN
jgi:hypothetical protein